MIVAKLIKSTLTEIYSAANDNEVITCINCTNLDTTLGHPITIYIVPNGSNPGNENVLIKDFKIAPTDCLQIDTKLVLKSGDKVFAVSDQDDRVNCILSVAIPPNF